MNKNNKDKLIKLYQEVSQKNPWTQKNYTFPKEINPFENKKVFLLDKQMAQIPISPLQKSVLCGTCVGDSSLKLTKGYNKARIQCRHSTKQASWFFWKWLICLKGYSNGFDSILFQEPDGFQKKANKKGLGKLKISTHAREDLTQLHQIICRKNKIEIKRKWLNHMNNYFLMTLWLDDGSLYNKRQGVFCLDSMPYKQQIILSKYLKKIWKIDCHVKQTKIKMANGQLSYRLFISHQDSLLRLLRTIAPLIPVREMLYKIMFVPKNNINLLQRWTSEVIELVHTDFKDQLKQDYDKILDHQKKI